MGFTFGVKAHQFYVGVSGSNSSHSASISGSTRGMSTSGSDYTHLLQSEVGHIRGVIRNGVWSTGGALIIARKVDHMKELIIYLRLKANG